MHDFRRAEVLKMKLTRFAVVYCVISDHFYAASGQLCIPLVIVNILGQDDGVCQVKLAY